MKKIFLICSLMLSGCSSFSFTGNTQSAIEAEVEQHEIKTEVILGRNENNANTIRHDYSIKTISEDELNDMLAGNGRVVLFFGEGKIRAITERANREVKVPIYELEDDTQSSTLAFLNDYQLSDNSMIVLLQGNAETGEIEKSDLSLSELMDKSEIRNFLAYYLGER